MKSKEWGHFRYFLLFSTIRTSSQHLRDGVQYLRIGEYPHRALQLQLWQIKIGFRSFNSLFSECCLPPAHSTFRLFMTHAIVSTSHPCVCVYVCVTMKQIPQDVYTHGDVFVCVCCGFGRNVSDPAPFTTVEPCFQSVSAKFFHNKVEQQKKKATFSSKLAVANQRNWIKSPESRCCC